MYLQYEGTHPYVTQIVRMGSRERQKFYIFRQVRIHHCGTSPGKDSEQWPLQARKAKMVSQKAAQTTFQSKKRSYKSLPKLVDNIKWKKSKTVSLALHMNLLCITHFLILKNQSILSALTFNIWNLGFNHKRKVL